MWFTSDNAGPAAPEVMAAVAAANEGHALPYGADEVTARAAARLREAFEAPEAVVHFVATGTAANSLALACLAAPWSAVYCHEAAHIEVDECGGPEFYTGGAKLTTVPGGHAKIDPEALEARLAGAGAGTVHHVQPGAVSITQATEYGAVHRPEEVAEIARVAEAHGLALHMDGTRFANAVARLGCTPAELSWKAGVDALCLGATKCGALAAEAVVFFDGDKARAWEFELRRKRGGHLFSKMRFVAAQMDAWLTDGLWLRLAGEANARADRLAEGLRASNLAALPHPVEANMLFPRLPRAAHRRLHEAGARYHFWPQPASLEGPEEEMIGCRMVCHWGTPEADVDAALAAIRG